MKETVLEMIPFLVDFSFSYTQFFTLFLLILSVQFFYAVNFNKVIWWKELDSLTKLKTPSSFLEISTCATIISLFFLGLWTLFKIEKTVLISLIFQLVSFVSFSLGFLCFLLKKGIFNKLKNILNKLKNILVY